MRRLLITINLSIIVLANLPPQQDVTQTQDLEFREIQRLGDRGVAHSVEWSPDGSVVAIGGSDGVWLYRDNFENEAQIQSTEIGGGTWYVEWSPDGRFLAAFHWERTSLLRVWEVETGAVYLEETFTPFETDIYWSPDSQRVAMSSYDLVSDDERLYFVNVWDVVLGERIQQYAINIARVSRIWLFWNEDGTILASGAVGTDRESTISQVTMWNISNPQPINRYRYVHQGFARRLSWVEWSPDGSKLAGVINSDAAADVVVVLGVDGQREVIPTGNISPEAFVRTIAWDGDDFIGGEVLDSSPSSERWLTIWDADTGETVSQSSIDGLITWNADRSLGAVVSNDYATSTRRVEVIQTDNGMVDTIFEANVDGQGYLSVITWTKGGEWLIGTTERSVRSRNSDEFYRIFVWDIETGEAINVFDIPIFRDSNGYLSDRFKSSSFFVSPDGETLVVAEATVSVWNVRTGDLIRQIWEYMPPVTALSWSPDGSKLASASPYETCVWIWDIESGNVVDTICHDYWVNTVAWSPDGSMIATGMQPLELDGETSTLSPYIFVWDVETGELIDSFASQFERISVSLVGVYKLAWSFNGEILLVASTDLSFPRRSISVWDRDTHEIHPIPDQELTILNYFTIDWAEDELTVISSAVDFDFSETFILWDVESNAIAAEIVGPDCECNFGFQTLRMTDGRLIGFAHSKAHVDLWDIEAQQMLTTFAVENEDLSLVVDRSFRWNPENDHILAYDTRIVRYGEIPVDEPSGKIMIWALRSAAEDDYELAGILERPPRNFGYSESFSIFSVPLPGYTGENALEWSPDGSMIAHGGNDLDSAGIIIWQNDGD